MVSRFCACRCCDGIVKLDFVGLYRSLWLSYAYFSRWPAEDQSKARFGKPVRREVELKIQPEFFGIEPASQRAQRLASLLTLSYEPMFVWQLNGPIDFWNTGAERLYGFASEETVGRSSHTLHEISGDSDAY